MRGPLIRKFEAGYEAGVRAVCPDCTVHSAYIGTSPEAFKDPAKGKRSRLRRLEPAPTCSTTRPAQAATASSRPRHDAKRFAIGVDADQYAEMPDTIVTSMVKRADVSVFDAIRAVTEHRFEGGMRVFGVKDGASTTCTRDRTRRSCQRRRSRG